MHAVRIEQEGPILIHRQAEVVADAFVHAEAHRGAKGRRKIAPRYLKGWRRDCSRSIRHVTLPVWLAGVSFAIGRAARRQNRNDAVEEAS
jgi:hypothetical protein